MHPPFFFSFKMIFMRKVEMCSEKKKSPVIQPEKAWLTFLEKWISGSCYLQLYMAFSFPSLFLNLSEV